MSFLSRSRQILCRFIILSAVCGCFSCQSAANPGSDGTRATTNHQHERMPNEDDDRDEKINEQSAWHFDDENIDFSSATPATSPAFFNRARNHLIESPYPTLRLDGCLLACLPNHCYPYHPPVRVLPLVLWAKSKFKRTAYSRMWVFYDCSLFS